ncbi:hypothetical protein ACE7GA_09470 [Roseomonas sp. CCTCC AB2023176]|uniref:hypothetical protein n=1 Tax=Roseomonas sp. CCTCC AB2023176 TaxID=3342640 RepID=UPI0035DDCA68
MFRLERPNTALNDPRVSATVGGRTFKRRFQMENTWDISTDETVEHMVEWVAYVASRATGGKLKHLVLSGHGNEAYLQVGRGIGRADLVKLDPWKGKIEKIWLPNCLVAHIGATPERDGNLFCSEMAKRVGCYLVAATETQCESPTDVPPDMMTSFEGLQVCYGPNGDLTWQSRNPSMWMRTAPDGSQQCVPVPN